MAKPGSDEARELTHLAARAKDLAAERSAPPEIAAKLRERAEGQLGMRCSGCGERITVGFQFTRIDVVIGGDGKPRVDVAKLSACDRDECDFAERARPNSDIVEVVEFAWLSDENGDPIPTRAAGV